jgi:hypothetical protein
MLHQHSHILVKLIMRHYMQTVSLPMLMPLLLHTLASNAEMDLTSLEEPVLPTFALMLPTALIMTNATLTRPHVSHALLVIFTTQYLRSAGNAKTNVHSVHAVTTTSETKPTVEFVTTSSIVMKLALDHRVLLSQQSILKIVLEPSQTVSLILMLNARVQQLLIQAPPLFPFKAANHA